MRSGNLFSKRGTAVLDTPANSRASGDPHGFASSSPQSVAPLRRTKPPERPLRSEFSDPYPDGYDDLSPDGEFSGRKRPSIRLSFSRGLPQSTAGRVALVCGLLAVLGGSIAGLLFVRSYLLRDEHFVVQSSASVQIEGNAHLTRPQLFSVFGEDVERNIFNIPLTQRRAELESLPWVAHATVMRLLPNRVRVSISERTPVAFVRQGKEIGLVDANGVLLDLASPVDPDEPSDNANAPPVPYSFPVLTGISAEDPLSTRAARMKIFTGFLKALDSTNEKISARLSEVDLSNPEDVKAVIPDMSRSADHPLDILVHFGNDKYLDRYRKYQEHLPEWRAQYPKLASVDMRYERQVVLEMQPGSTVPVAGNGAVGDIIPPAKTVAARAGGALTSGKHPAAAKGKPAPAKLKPAATTVPAAPTTHLDTAFTPVKAAPAGAKPATHAASTPTQGAPR